MPTWPDDKLTNQLGTKGVILKNSIYQNKLCLWCFILYFKFYNGLENILFISPLPNPKLNKKHIQLPIVAQVCEIKKPGIPPNKAPDIIDKNTAPGIANDCKNKYIYIKHPIIKLLLS